MTLHKDDQLFDLVERNGVLEVRLTSMVTADDMTFVSDVPGAIERRAKVRFPGGEVAETDIVVQPGDDYDVHFITGRALGVARLET